MSAPVPAPFVFAFVLAVCALTVGVSIGLAFREAGPKLTIALVITFVMVGAIAFVAGLDADRLLGAAPETRSPTVCRVGSIEDLHAAMRWVLLGEPLPAAVEAALIGFERTWLWAGEERAAVEAAASAYCANEELLRGQNEGPQNGGVRFEVPRLRVVVEIDAAAEARAEADAEAEVRDERQLRLLTIQAQADRGGP